MHNSIFKTQKSLRQLSDLAGHTVIQQKLINASSQNIDISTLAKGMYIVKIIASGIVQTQKLVVQ